MLTGVVSRCAHLQWLCLVAATATTLSLDTTPPTLVNVSSPQSPPCLPSLSVELAAGAEQLGDGSLRVPPSDTLPKGGDFPPGTYWLPSPNKPLRGCICMAGPPCFIKCCPWNQYMHNRQCVPTNETTPAFDVDTNEPRRRWLLGSGIPRDPSRFQFIRLDAHRLSEDAFTLLDNASLHVPGHRNSLYPPGQFCMEVFSDIGQVSVLVGLPKDHEAQVVEQVETFYFVGLSVSLPFLLATLLVYMILPELRNLHGKTFMSYVGSMAAGYLDLIFVQIDFLPINFCPHLGFFLQFSFLACFFWLNVMCYDIWSTFRGSRPTKGSGCSKGRDRRKFIWYSLYAWGCPLLLLSITLALYFTPDLPTGYWRPQIGVQRCFFETFESKLSFFLGPVSIIVAANVALFAHTAWRLAKLRRETAALQTADSQRHSEDDRQRFILYLKLFLVMGLNWVAEIVSTYFPSLSYVWIITDMANTLQGIFIFVMFVCKRRVWRLLKARFKKQLPNARSSGCNSTGTTDVTINGSQHSSYSKRARMPPPRQPSVT